MKVYRKSTGNELTGNPPDAADITGYQGSEIDLLIEGISKTSSGGASVTAKFEPTNGADKSGISKDTIHLTVYGIESVTWKKAKSGSPDIGSDQHPTDSLDKRIFPGATSADDSTDRSTAMVVVELTPALYGIDVYLDYYDIDDPTAKDLPLDDDPSGVQPDKDNRGFVDGETDGGFPNGNEPLTVTTGRHGKAKGEFSVAMQPGDNYRVVAATTASQFNKISALHPDSGGRVFHQDDSSLEVTESGPAAAVTSPALTVWRKLRLEIDSMARSRGTSGASKLRKQQTTPMARVP